MYQKKKISIMLIVIIIMQVILPMLTVIWENKLTIKSIAAEKKSGDWEYEINEDGETITIIEYNGTEANLIIPEKIDGYIVTELGNGRHVDSTINSFSVFSKSYTIKTVKLPNSMKKIASMAFKGCKNLESVELNNGLETIGNQAFYECEKINIINIPRTVKEIKNNCDINSFYGCTALSNINVDTNNQYFSSIDGVLFNKEKSVLIAYPSAKENTEYTIPETVTQVFGRAINNQNLTTININKNVNQITDDLGGTKGAEELAIINCKNLKNISVDAGNNNFSSENGILYNKSKSSLLLYPSGKQDTYFAIPSTVLTCNSIDSQYIETIKLNSLIDNIEFLIGIDNLKNIQVDTTNTNYIQKNGVLLNKNSNKIVLYPMGRSDTTYTCDNNITEIGEKAFYNSKLTKIIIPTSVNKIGGYAFYNCRNLIEINLPSNITSIGEYAFYNCSSIATVTIPNNVITIGNYAFYKCTNIEKLMFEKNSKIQILGYNCFSGCSKLEEIDIPEGITNINDCFNDCNNLRTINIPTTVSEIVSYCFDSIYTRPQIITINNENPSISNAWAFSAPDNGMTIIRCNSTATNVINWANSRGAFHYNLIDLGQDDEKFLYTISENNEVTITDYIGDEENVKIPSFIEGYPVTSVGKCIGTYKTLTISSTVKSIGKIYSYNLENIIVDDENDYFTSKDQVLFNKAENELVHYPTGKKDRLYNIPEGVTKIGGNTSVTIGTTRYVPIAFFGNEYLESINIPKTVEQIDNGQFSIGSLKQISVDENNKKYIAKDDVLYELNKDNIKIIKIPRMIEGNIELLYGLTGISTYSFSNVDKLESVVIPTTVKSISNNSFEYCKNLKKIVIPASKATLAEINGGNLILRALSGDFKIYCENESTVQEYARKWNIPYEIIKPIQIKIKQMPNKLSYIKSDENLNLECGLITITYDDETSVDLSMESDLLDITGFDNSRIGQNEIKINYNGNETSFNINIVEEEVSEKALTGIAVTKAPSKTSYVAGQNFNKTGMKITASYNDGSTKEVANYTVTDGNNLTVGKTSVTISYTENGVTKTTTQNITVVAKALTGIAVTTAPSKTSYVAGQNFNKTGM